MIIRHSIEGLLLAGDDPDRLRYRSCGGDWSGGRVERDPHGRAIGRGEPLESILALYVYSFDLGQAGVAAV